jgi:hypothetical protein
MSSTMDRQFKLPSRGLEIYALWAIENDFIAETDPV